MEQLETRVLFDASFDPAIIEAIQESDTLPEFQFLESPVGQLSQTDPGELILVDASLNDSHTLLNEILSQSDTNFTVVMIESDSNGISQVTEALERLGTNFSAIHILTHGDSNEFQLGNSSINNNNVNAFADELSGWSNALADGADILLYGCNLAASDDGQMLLERIGQLAGADIAASDDLTGAATLGGDWDLEFSQGEIQTAALTSSQWQGTLALEASDGIVAIQDAEQSGAGTITLSNDGNPETVTASGTPRRVDQRIDRTWQFSETADTGRASFVFDISGIAGINGTIASDFGLIVSDQSDLSLPDATTLVASGYDAANGLVYFHQVDLNDGDYFSLATEVVADNFSISPTASGPEDTPIDLGIELFPSLTDGGQLQDTIGTATGFRSSTAGANSTDFLIPAGTTGIRITGYSTRDIGTNQSDELNDDYQRLFASIDLGTETSSGFIAHIVDQGPNRSDQFGWSDAPLGQAILSGSGTVTGDANDNINPTFTIVDGVLQVTENHQLQTAYHVEFLTNATSSAEFIRTESAVRESGDQSPIELTIPSDADFLVINISDSAAGDSFAVEYKGNNRIYLDLTTLRASGVVAAQQGETDGRVISYAFEDYDVSSSANGSILNGAGSVVGDTTGQATVINDNQIYINASGNLVIERNSDFASDFNSLVTVEYNDRIDVGSSAAQLGESTAFGLWDNNTNNTPSVLSFDIPENATLGTFNLSANGTSSSDTNENSGSAFAVIDLVNGTSSGSIFMVRASSVVDLVGWNETPFGTEFFDDPNSVSNHDNIGQFNDPAAGNAQFRLTNDGRTLELVTSANTGNQSFLDYLVAAQIEWFGAEPVEIDIGASGGTFNSGTLNPNTGQVEFTIEEAAAGIEFIPAEHVSTSAPLEVSITIGEETETTMIRVEAVIDPISFAGIPDANGNEDTQISISANVTPAFTDQDGSETITSRVLSGIPAGHTLTDGANVFTSTGPSQTLDITAWDIPNTTYQANPNEHGTFTITLDIDYQDVGGGVVDSDSVRTTFDVVVDPVNDTPVAVNDNYTVLGNATLTIAAASGVLNNDSDLDGDTLTVSVPAITAPANGLLILSSDGSFEYTPNTGFSGTDFFVYEVNDGNGGTATATAFIDVSEPVTGPLQANPETVTTDEETLININVMSNDDLPTTGAFNIQSTTPPSNGIVLVRPDGTIDYTPDLNFFGTDSFTYTLADASGRTSTATVTVMVDNVQDTPAANADSGSTNEDTTLTNIDVLSNDSDPDNDTLTVTAATASNGSVTINPDGTIDYTPNANFSGSDTINYTISDGNGGTANSTVLINVVPIADPPTSTDLTITVDEDGEFIFSNSQFAFSDVDPGDVLTVVRIDTLPANGELLLSGTAVTAGQVVSLTDINAGRLTFSPEADEFGINYANFDFSVSDGQLFQTTPNTITIDVTGIQDPPTATNNTITVDEESTGNALGLTTPSDPDGDTLTVTITGLPTLGTVFLSGGTTPVNNGDTLTIAELTSLTYDAPLEFSVANAGSFTYDITDGTATDSGQVDISIAPINDAPTVDLNGTNQSGTDYTDTFTEGGFSVSITDSAISISDIDDTTLTSILIDFDAGTILDAGHEQLTIGGTDFLLDLPTDFSTPVTLSGISYSVSYLAAPATLQIARTDAAEIPVADVESILSSIRYRNDSVLPTESDRIFNISVNDGESDSNVATSTIEVSRDAESAAWSISGSNTVIDGASASYTLTLSNAIRIGETATVNLGLNDGDTNSSDYASLSTAIENAVAGYTGPGDVDWDGTTFTFTSDGSAAFAGLTFALPTTPDGVYEGDEDFSIVLSSPGSTTGQTITLTNSSVTTTITDNDAPPIVSIGNGSAVEGSPVVFTISLDRASFEDITLDLSVASGSAIAGTDFESTNFEYFDGSVWQPATSGTQVTLVAGTTSLQVRIDSTPDTIVENDENFTLSASVLSGTVTNATDTGTGTIVDDDLPAISVDNVSVDEDAGSITFTISLDQAPVNSVSVDWATASGTADSGVDFTASMGSVTFAAGEQTKTVTIGVTNDNLYEGPETLNINLSAASGATISDATGVGTIFDDGNGPNGTDDDRPVVSINNITVTEETDPHAVFTISLSNPSVEDTVLSLALVSGTATAADFGPGLEAFISGSWQPVTGNVAILAGQTSLQIRTPIIDDAIADDGDMFSLVATHVNGTVFDTANKSGFATIQDESPADTTTVSLSGPGSVTEGDTATYTVTLTNTPQSNVTVTLTYSGTATGGADYSAIATVSIPSGSTSSTFDIVTIDDSLGEPLENLQVTIDAVSGGTFEDLQISASNFQVATNIVDDDVPTVSVNDVVVTEGTDMFAEFTVELSNPTFEDISFSISATGISATGDGVDFGVAGPDEIEIFDGTTWVAASTATFTAGQTALLVRTAIIDDVDAETVETFEITATTTAGTTTALTATGTGTIQEDNTSLETILVSLSGASAVAEGNTATYNLTLNDSAIAIEDVTVTFVYTGTATDGSDFTGVATATILTGNSSQTFDLTTVDDAVYETSETIEVSILSVTGGGFEQIAADPLADSVTTTINDDTDIPTVAIGNVTSLEGTDAFAVFTVELSNLSVEDVELQLSVAGNTATGGGVDFGAADGSNIQVFDGTNWVNATQATISAGDMSVLVRVPIVDDPIDEPDETYDLTVDVDAGTTTNIRVIGTGTITDEDPAPTITIDDATAIEGSQLVFNVSLSNPSSEPVVVAFNTSDLTATSASDYVAGAFEFSNDGGASWIAAANGNEVTIAANATSILIRFSTQQDNVLESTETLQVSVDSVVSGTVGDFSDTAIGTINDDDTAVASIVANDSDAGEPGNNGQFTITLSNPSDTDTTIAYTISGSADSGTDFSSLSGTITLTAGQTSAVIDVSVLDDAISEGDEEVTLTLDSITNGDSQITIDSVNNSATVNITDDDELIWSITGDTTVNEGAEATYVLQLIGTPQSGETAAIQLLLDAGTTSPDDYDLFSDAIAAAAAAYSGPGEVTATGTTLTFTSDGSGPMDQISIVLAANNDTVVEGSESFSVMLAVAGSTTGAAVEIDSSDFQVTTAIADTVDAAGTSLDTASWSITGPPSVNEGEIANFVITTNAELQSGETATVNLSLSNIDTAIGDLTVFSNGVVQAVETYNGLGPGSLSFDGTTLTFTSDGTGAMGDLVIEIGAFPDGLLEGPEDFEVILSNPGSTTGADIELLSGQESQRTTIDPVGDPALWSIGGATLGEEGEVVTYTISLQGVFGAGDTASVDLNLIQQSTNATDYADFAAAVSLAADNYSGQGSLAFDGTNLEYTATNDGDEMSDLVVSLELLDEALAEGDESFQIQLNNSAGNSGINVLIDTNSDSVTTIISEDDSLVDDSVTWSITGLGSVNEGAIAQFEISLAGTFGAGESASVVIEQNVLTTLASDLEEWQAAISNAVSTLANVSFDSDTNTLTFTSPSEGATMPAIQFGLTANADAIIEGDESFEFTLTTPTSSTGLEVLIDGTANNIETTINDLTTAAQWAISGPANADEGETAQFIFTLSGTFGDGETASVVVDFEDISTLANDRDDWQTAVNTAVDARSDLTFNDDTGVLTFTSPSEASTFAPLVVDLLITDDANIEGSEQFSVTLTSPTSTTGIAVDLDTSQSSLTTTINDTQGIGGALDGPGQFSITGTGNGVEGSTARYTISLSGTYGIDEIVTVEISLTDLGTTNSDYNDVVQAIRNAANANPDVTFNSTTGVLTYTSPSDGASMTDLLVDVVLSDDALAEGPEAFSLRLTGATSTTGANVLVDSAANEVTTTIIDNDVAIWNLIGDTSVNEGAAAQFTISLAGVLQAGETATIDLSLVNGTTTVADYASFVAAVNTAIGSRTDLTFDETRLIYTGDGSAMANLTVSLAANDDSLIEGDESFTISIASPDSTTGVDTAVGMTSVTTTITDNDVAIWNLIGDTSVNEGAAAQFTISLDGVLQDNETATINLSLINGTTTTVDYAGFVAAVNTAIGSRTDLMFDGTTLTYTGDGNAMADLVVSLTANDDILVEGDESFTVSIADPDSTTGSAITTGTNSVTTTITDNDVAIWNLIGDTSVNEGQDAVYTIFLSGNYQAGETASVQVNLTDLGTNSNDFGDLVAAFQAAADSNPDVDFNASTSTLTYTAPTDNASLTPLTIEIPVSNDQAIEPTESYRLGLSTPGSTTGVATSISATAGSVVTAINGPPVSGQDINQTMAGVPVTGNVLTNDFDPNGDPVQVTMVNGVPIEPAVATDNGTVVIDTNGDYIYTPNPGFVGTDSFEYEVCDADGNCVTESVSIEILDTETTDNNPRPIANNDEVSVFAGGAVTVSLTSNDSDPIGEVIAIDTTPISGPDNGTLVINTDGTIVYLPNIGFSGTDSFIYEIVDESGNRDQATVNINVYEDPNGLGNDAPFASDDAVSTTKGISAEGDLLANDVDPNGDSLTINLTPVEGPTNGMLTIDPDGTFTYTPDPGYEGTDSFVYEVCDADLACTQATAYITTFNQPPVAVDDTYELSSFQPFTANVLDNDSDPDSDPLTTSLVDLPQHGTVSLGSDGTFTYTPGATFTGVDSFSYEVCDDTGACRSATVNFGLPFAFDSINNEALRDPFANQADSDDRNRNTLLIERIHALDPEPILAGYAIPGTHLVARIYGADGSIIGETSTTVPRTGTFVMHFFGTQPTAGSYVVIDHAYTENVPNNIETGFRLTSNTMRSMQLRVENRTEPTINSILNDVPSNSLNGLHAHNLNPLMLLD